jgi:hypothetical protein
MVCAKTRSKFREKRAFPSAVAWWTIASGARLRAPPCAPRRDRADRDRLRAKRAHALAMSRRPERADHLVASIDQLGDEPGADRTARACNEDSHRVIPLGISQGHELAASAKD